MAHRVVRTGWHHRRQLNPHCLVAGANVSGGRPGRIGPLVRHGRDHRRRDGGSAQLADADRVDGHFIFTRRVIVEAQLGKVNHQPFARRIGQQRLQGDGQHAAGAGNIGVNPGIGLQQGQKTDIVLFGNRLQRTAVILHHVERILTYQPAARRGKGPGVGARGQSQRGDQRDQRQPERNGETVSHYHNSKIYKWLFLYEKQMRLWRESVWGNPGGLQNVCKDCEVCGKGDTAAGPYLLPVRRRRSLLADA